MAVNENAELEALIRNAIDGGTEPPSAAVAGSAADEEDADGLDLSTLGLVARRSLVWVLLLLALGGTASWLYLRYTKPVYKSTSVLKIDQRTEAGVLGLGGPAADGPRTGKLAGEVQLIKSEIIYKQLRDSLGLDVNYYVEGTVLERELYGNSPFHIAYTIKDKEFYNQQIGLAFISPTRYRLSYSGPGTSLNGEYALGQQVSLPGLDLRVTPTAYFNATARDQKYHFTIQDVGTVNGYLEKNLGVEILSPDANTIQISFTDFNSGKAQRIVNKVDTVYQRAKILREQEAAARTLRYIDEQLGNTNDNLQRAENRMQGFVEKTKTYDVKSEVAAFAAQSEALEEQRLKLNQNLALLNDIARMVRETHLTHNEDETVEQSIPGLGDINDPILSQLLGQLNGMQWEQERLRRSYTGATEAVQQKNALMTYTLSSIERQLVQARKALLTKIERLEQQQTKLDAKQQGLPGRATEQTRLQRPLNLAERNYDMLMSKKVDFNMQKAGTTADFQILFPASDPHVPISPVRFIVYAIGLAGGLFLGLGLIAVRYLLHNTITTTRELERSTHAAVLGVIPTYDKEKMEVSRLVVNDNPKSAISEAVRSIRTNLDFISSAKKKRLISVTSTISGEGKTFVTVNLAGIIAMSGQRVIILDLDMRKPKVNLAFGAENVKGVSTILIDRHSAPECIQRTSIESLQFISAGPTPPNPSELILSPRFDQLLAELYESYDVVMIDTPPVGLVTDGILIMRKADIPIYIVRADYSRKAFIKNMNRLMRTNNLTRMCTILNDAQSKGAYGYGYGYGSYGQGYYEEPTKPPTLGQKLGRLFK